MQTSQEYLLTPAEAGEFLALSPSWLAKLRLTGDGPQFIKIGRRVRYRTADLIRWAEAGLCKSTSGGSPAPQCQAAPQPAMLGRKGKVAQ